MTLVGPLTSIGAGLPGGISAALDVTAAGVVKGAPGICCRIAVIAAGTGTLTVNDAATTGSASAANAIFSNSVTVGQVIEINWPCGSGITVSAVPSGGQVAVSFS